MTNVNGTVTFNVSMNILGRGINTFCVDEDGFVNDPDMFFEQVLQGLEDGYVECIGVDTESNGYNGYEYTTDKCDDDDDDTYCEDDSYED